MSGQCPPRPAALLSPLFNQFARPSGLLARLAGRLMAKGIEDDEGLVNLLEIEPTDRVLEVGFDHSSCQQPPDHATWTCQGGSEPPNCAHPCQVMPRLSY